MQPDAIRRLQPHILLNTHVFGSWQELRQHGFNIADRPLQKVAHLEGEAEAVGQVEEVIGYLPRRHGACSEAARV